MFIYIVGTLQFFGGKAGHFRKLKENTIYIIYGKIKEV